MHEIGVVRSMVKTVTDFAGQNDIKEVAEIVLDIGELSLVIPKYVEDIYPVVVEDTWLKDTKLVINVIPGMAECDECNELFNVIEHEGYCPNCDSFEKTILSGKDFLIREIHIPEDRKHLGSMFTMEPLSVQKVRDFFIRFKNATFFVKRNFHKKSRCARQKA